MIDALSFLMGGGLVAMLFVAGIRYQIWRDGGAPQSRAAPASRPVQNTAPDHLRMIVDLVDSADRKIGELIEETKAVRGASAQLVSEMQAVRDESRKFRVMVFGSPDGDTRPADMEEEATRERQTRQYMRDGGVDRATAEARLAESFMYRNMRVEDL